MTKGQQLAVSFTYRPGLDDTDVVSASIDQAISKETMKETKEMMKETKESIKTYIKEYLDVIVDVLGDHHTEWHAHHLSPSLRKPLPITRNCGIESALQKTIPCQNGSITTRNPSHRSIHGEGEQRGSISGVQNTGTPPWSPDNDKRQHLTVSDTYIQGSISRCRDWRTDKGGIRSSWLQCQFNGKRHPQTKSKHDYLPSKQCIWVFLMVFCFYLK